MTLNDVMALILRYFISPNFRVRCRRKTIIRPSLGSKSTFDILWPY